MNFKALFAFFSQFYERIIAVFMMLLLVVFSVWLVIRVNDLEKEISIETIAPKGSPVLPSDFSQFTNSLAQFEVPPVWTTNADHRIFLAPLMKLFPGQTIPEAWNPKVINWEYSNEGIAISWLRKHGFSVVEPVGNDDQDGDGFNNWEEYKADTDPLDPKSKPDLATKLRVHSVTPNTLAFIFNGIQEMGNEKVFSIQRRDGAKTYFVKLNAVIPDVQYPGYKIIKFEEKAEPQPDPTIKGNDGKPLVKIVDI